MNTNLDLFFQCSNKNFVEVWNVHQHIQSNDFVCVSNTSLNHENFMYYGQSTWEEKMKSLGNKKELVSLLESNKIYIKTPPLIHPAFRAKIAEILNFTETELLGLANYTFSFVDNQFVKRKSYDTFLNSGTYFIKSLLESKVNTVAINNDVVNASQLLITRIPLLPLKKRLFLNNVFDYKTPGVENVNYQLIYMISKQLFENEYFQDSFFATSHNFLQQYFEELLITIQHNYQDNRWSTLKKVKALRNTKSLNTNNIKIKEVVKPSKESLCFPFYRTDLLAFSNKTPLDCLFVDESKLCIQFKDRIVFYDFMNFKEEKILAIPYYKLVHINFQKNCIQLYGCKDLDKHQISDFIHYDFLTKKWFSGEIEGFDYIELSHEVERQRLVNYKYNIEVFLNELSKYPTKKIFSVCRKYMWINDKYGIGGLFDLTSGLCVVHSSSNEFLDSEIHAHQFKEFSNLIKNNEALKEDLYKQQKDNRFELGALAIIEKEWIMLHDNVVYINNKEVFEIDYPYTCSAFNPEASKLILVNKIGILIIEVDSILLNKEMNYEFIKYSSKI